MKIFEEEKEIIKDFGLDLRRSFKVDFSDMYFEYVPIISKLLKKLDIGESIRLSKITITRAFSTTYRMTNNAL